MGFEESDRLMGLFKRLQQRYQFPIVRIDDRLIHGQVILGWVEPLKIRSLIFALDTYARDEDLKTTIAATIPPHLDFSVVSLSDVASILNNPQKNKRLMVVVESPEAVNTILANGGEITTVIIGGLHYQGDRTELLPYVFMTRAEVDLVTKIVESGVDVTCQDLPGTSPVLWEDIKEKLEVR